MKTTEETTMAQQTTRTEDQWWAWHDADAERWSADHAAAEQRCAAWVAGESDDGPAATEAEAQQDTTYTIREPGQPCWQDRLSTLGRQAVGGRKAGFRRVSGARRR